MIGASPAAPSESVESLKCSIELRRCSDEQVAGAGGAALYSARGAWRRGVARPWDARVLLGPQVGRTAAAAPLRHCRGAARALHRARCHSARLEALLAVCYVKRSAAAPASHISKEDLQCSLLFRSTLVNCMGRLQRPVTLAVQRTSVSQWSTYDILPARLLNVFAPLPGHRRVWRPGRRRLAGAAGIRRHQLDSSRCGRTVPDEHLQVR